MLVAYGMLAMAIIAGIFVLAIRRIDAEPVDWVCTREGLARFGPGCVWFFPWSSIDLEGGRFTASGEYFDLGAGRVPATPPLPRPTEWVTIRASAAVDVRAALPTFRQPDGPPEAVLAGIPEAPHELSS